MTIAIVYSRAQVGIKAPLVTIEVHLTNGLPSLSIVGLPEAAVKESKDRVRSALINSKFEFPLKRITINLAPADLPKEGGRFDLPIALGILIASGQLPSNSVQDYECVGELALTGELRPIRGALPVAIATSSDHRKLIVPTENCAEATLVTDCKVYPAAHLLAVCAHLHGSEPLTSYTQRSTDTNEETQLDLADVKAQHHAKRALEIAASGGHNLLMVGPPGTGKSMLARRLPSILPPMTDTEAMEAAAIASISTTGFKPNHWRQRAFRAPHHTASGIALVGGGSQPKPGEISLAHHGVLFLDELPEFDRKVLEVLREPLETGHISISRAAQQADFPANFQLIAAMNPCPCGYLGDREGRCRCTAEQIKRYRNKISGPLLDRIDMHIEVPQLAKDALFESHGAEETSATVKARVIAAREMQWQRSQKENAKLDNREIETHCELSKSDKKLLGSAIDRMNLSARSVHRILKVTRTVADLAVSEKIQTTHLMEALSYRKVAH